jgi:predicted RNase H-like HicB family nuclease
MSWEGMAPPMETYTVIYERDEEGWWVAEVPEVPGCHTQGRTIEQARERILDAPSLYVDEATHILLHEEVRVPEGAACVAPYCASSGPSRTSRVPRVLGARVPGP